MATAETNTDVSGSSVMRFSHTVLALTLVASPAAGQTTSVSFQAFWAARSAFERGVAAEAIIVAGTSFGSAYSILKTGRPYTANVATGVVERVNTIADGTDHPYFYRGSGLVRPCAAV